jgi:hypothetical protein
MFPHGNIRKYTWISPDKTIHFIYLMSNVTVQLIDTDHYLVVARVRERLLVSKQESQQFVVSISSLKKLNMEVTEHYQIKILTNICITVGTSIPPWPSIREHTKISGEDNLGQNERKRHKPKCDGVSQIFTSKEQAKLQWVQDTSQIHASTITILQ